MPPALPRRGPARCRPPQVRLPRAANAGRSRGRRQRRAGHRHLLRVRSHRGAPGACAQAGRPACCALRRLVVGVVVRPGQAGRDRPRPRLTVLSPRAAVTRNQVRAPTTSAGAAGLPHPAAAPPSAAATAAAVSLSSTLAAPPLLLRDSRGGRPGQIRATIPALASFLPNPVRSSVYAAAATANRSGSPPSARSG